MCKTAIKKIIRNDQRRTVGFPHRHWKKDETGLEDAKYPKEAVEIIKEHQELFKCQNSKIINIADKQGEPLKRFKGPDWFLEGIA